MVPQSCDDRSLLHRISSKIRPVAWPPVQPEALTHEKIMRSEAELQLGFTLLEGEKRRRRYCLRESESYPTIDISAYSYYSFYYY
jgi:hypothetical protein